MDKKSIGVFILGIALIAVGFAGFAYSNEIDDRTLAYQSMRSYHEALWDQELDDDDFCPVYRADRNWHGHRYDGDEQYMGHGMMRYYDEDCLLNER